MTQTNTTKRSLGELARITAMAVIISAAFVVRPYALDFARLKLRSQPPHGRQ